MLNKILNLEGVKKLERVETSNLSGGVGLSSTGYYAYGCNNGKTGTARSAHNPHELCKNDGGTAYWFAVFQ